ncbi:MAG TPA: HAMP domain-containing sensor histidine kinase [Kofleriaceae bacterium]|nr:HAMP domain-containing sensor histidine kinase [Kofleriaceae bacterium]
MATVSELIARHHDTIMRCWLEQAGAVSSARGLAAPALQNLMPRYLASLQAPGGDGHGQVESHFATRLRQGFLLTEIVEELELLGRCIADTWAGAPPEERPDPVDVDRLHAELYRVSARIVEVYAAHMAEDEQTEKRYLRLLQEVATDALHRGPTALRERLPEVLGLVMEAIGARGAALMLRSGDCELEMAVTAGAVAKAPYTTTLEGTSFAAAVAHSEEPISILDAWSTELEIPDALRRSGLHALLGVRLCSTHGLSGLLCVGLTEVRPFTAREVRRLEVLAHHLAVHLENASLVADLGAKIEALHGERSVREHFVSVLAHDLRGPLAAARLAAQLVMERPEILEMRRELAVRIDRNLDRMDRMIRDLLDASRIRAGERLPLRLDRCDLGQITYEIAEELRALYGKRIEIDGDSHVHGVWSTDELRRALWNLVTNAMKYGDPKRPIGIALHRLGEHARVAVHNWGAPISPEDQASLFEPFARTRTATRSGRLGWGLGLALVRGCAEAHGGTVSLDSSHEAGTTFTIEIPLDARPHQLVFEGAVVPPSGSVH